MSEYKKPMDLTPCAPHLIAVHFADENYTATPIQQKMLCDEIWKRWNNHDRLVEALRPFAIFACSPDGECDCNNCTARALLTELENQQ